MGQATRPPSTTTADPTAGPIARIDRELDDDPGVEQRGGSAVRRSARLPDLPRPYLLDRRHPVSQVSTSIAPWTMVCLLRPLFTGWVRSTTGCVFAHSPVTPSLLGGPRARALRPLDPALYINRARSRQVLLPDGVPLPRHHSVDPRRTLRKGESVSGYTGWIASCGRSSSIPRRARRTWFPWGRAVVRGHATLPAPGIAARRMAQTLPLLPTPRPDHSGVVRPPARAPWRRPGALGRRSPSAPARAASGKELRRWHVHAFSWPRASRRSRRSP